MFEIIATVAVIVICSIAIAFAAVFALALIGAAIDIRIWDAYTRGIDAVIGFCEDKFTRRGRAYARSHR